MSDWDILDEEDEKKRSLLEEKLDSTLLENSLILLHGELTEKLCNLVCKELLYLGIKSKEKKIRVVLNSVGGEVYHGLLIYNTLEELVKKGFEIEIEARGVCASMAMIILQAATKRKASKYTRLLLHEVSGWTYGKASKVSEESKELGKVNKMLLEIICKKSKLTLKTLEKKIKKKDWWLSAEEALEYQLIDEVV